MIFTKQVNPYNLYCECSGESHSSDCRVKLTTDELKKLDNPISEKVLINAADRVYGDGYHGEDKSDLKKVLAMQTLRNSTIDFLLVHVKNG